jgi:DNA-directed RNA polymerase subunit RPC12/RpoP
MKIKALKCPECGANIELKEERDFCFCTYCGCKIIFDDEKQETTINRNTTYTERYIDEAEVIRAETEANESKNGNKIALLIIVTIAVVLGGIVGYAKHASNVEERELQQIVDEVLIDIENEDFEEAYVKANSLYYTSDWSRDIERKWNNTRKALIEQIEKAEKNNK